jgi:hypothetical protein
MSDKPWNKLNELDQLIRRTLRLGMDSGTFLKIEYIYGFELFNTRPYHNYETWAGGYRVTDTITNTYVEREDLDDAVKEWAAIAGPLIDAIRDKKTAEVKASQK